MQSVTELSLSTGVSWYGKGDHFIEQALRHRRRINSPIRRGLYNKARLGTIGWPRHGESWHDAVWRGKGWQGKEAVIQKEGPLAASVLDA